MLIAIGAKRKWLQKNYTFFSSSNNNYYLVLGDAGTSDALDYFTDSLAKFTKFSGFRCLATLSYASDIYSGSSIVSRSV